MNWEAEVINEIVKYYDEVEIRYHPKENAIDCLIDFLNLEMKRIKPVKRKILKSDSFNTSYNFLNAKEINALDYIEKKILVGQDITFHMSRKTLDPTYKDDLLNDWFIYHLHISDSHSKPSDKFYDRADHLLFIMYSKYEIFFIDIKKHSENYLFAKKEFLETVKRNWPQILEKYKDKEIKRLSHNYTDSDISIARKKGLTIGMIEVGGEIYHSPGVGITTAGTSMLVVKQADAVWRYLNDAMDQVKDEAAIKKLLSEESGIEITELDLCIHRLQKWPFFALYEKNSKRYIEKA